MAELKIWYTRGDRTVDVGTHNVKNHEDLYITIRECFEKILEVYGFGRLETEKRGGEK